MITIDYLDSSSELNILQFWQLKLAYSQFVVMHQVFQPYGFPFLYLLKLLWTLQTAKAILYPRDHGNFIRCNPVCGFITTNLCANAIDEMPGCTVRTIYYINYEYEILGQKIEIPVDHTDSLDLRCHIFFDKAPIEYYIRFRNSDHTESEI